MTKQLTVVVAISVFFVAGAGCSPPRVDVSSEDTYTASLRRVRDSVAEDRQPEFDQAVLTLTSQGIDLDRIAASAPGTDTMAAEMRAPLGGRTADEILQEAARLRAATAAAARKLIEAEIGELVAKQEAAFAARRQLAQIEILQTNLVPGRERGRLPGQPILIRVRNGTAHRIGRLHLDVVGERPESSMRSPRQAVIVPFADGLNPGDVKSVTVRIEGSDGAETNAASAAAALNITAMRIDGMNGEVLLDAGNYTEDDAARLIALQMQLTNTRP
jgi:hypothetical protein